MRRNLIVVYKLGLMRTILLQKTIVAVDHIIDINPLLFL